MALEEARSGDLVLLPERVTGIIRLMGDKTFEFYDREIARRRLVANVALKAAKRAVNGGPVFGT